MLKQLVSGLMVLCCTCALADIAVTRPGQVVVSGAVPDEATRVALIAKLRAIYGNDRVQDQLSVGGVTAPPEWSGSVQRLLTSELKAISHGELRIDGTQVTVRGETSYEATRQEVIGHMANALTPSYTIKNALRVAASDQRLLDEVLRNRTVEFEAGSVVLTEQGRKVLDEVVAVLQKTSARRVDIIGHTDNVGSRDANLVLSQARADAVKNYLLAAGLPAEYFTALGVGADRPIASNDLPDGRAKNRRIEFRLGQ